MTRAGFGVIALGALVLLLRAIGVIDSELGDIASVLTIVVGAVMVAIDGEAEAHPPA